MTANFIGAALVALLLASTGVAAQSTLPAPSRTIYKCVIKGAVSYSDEPCPGAQRLDATPVRGVNRLSGATRTGKDVAAELHNEQFAEVFRPISGMTDAEYARATRRTTLALAARRECEQLEPAILELEQAEKRASAATIKATQADLFTLRTRYKKLRC